MCAKRWLYSGAAFRLGWILTGIYIETRGFALRFAARLKSSRERPIT